VVVIFDETSAIHDKIWEVSEGALTDRAPTAVFRTAAKEITMPKGRAGPQTLNSAPWKRCPFSEFWARMS
jgi:hypothetical protein